MRLRYHHCGMGIWVKMHSQWCAFFRVLFKPKGSLEFERIEYCPQCQQPLSLSDLRGSSLLASMMGK